jgi:hypothetical protein
MGKRKKPEEGADNGTPAIGTAVIDAPAEPPAPTQSNGPPAEGQTPPPKNRPAASFAAYSDRTTRIEAAVWSKLVKVSEQEEYTQYALTLSRSWQKDGNWQGNASFRIHDIPVLLYLVQQAYNWCVAQRTEVKIGDEPLPF